MARRPAIEKIHPALRIADLAFDVNLLYSLKHAGFSVIEVPTEWTDKAGSKVSASLFRSSLTMFLSVVRIRLIYSPFYRLLRPLKPLETWVYRKLRQPAPRSGPESGKGVTPQGKSMTLFVIGGLIVALVLIAWAARN